MSDTDLIRRKDVTEILFDEGWYGNTLTRIDHLPAVQPAVHPAFDCRQWWNYVVPMPLTADDQGPATVGVDAAKMHYEVWDQDLVTHGSFDFLPDAINYAMALNYDLPAVQPAPVTVEAAARVLLAACPSPLFDQLKPVMMGEIVESFTGQNEDGEEEICTRSVSWDAIKQVIRFALRALAGEEPNE